jgi:hypothetical protein
MKLTNNVDIDTRSSRRVVLVGEGEGACAAADNTSLGEAGKAPWSVGLGNSGVDRHDSVLFDGLDITISTELIELGLRKVSYLCCQGCKPAKEGQITSEAVEEFLVVDSSLSLQLLDKRSTGSTLLQGDNVGVSLLWASNTLNALELNGGSTENGGDKSSESSDGEEGTHVCRRNSMKEL